MDAKLDLCDFLTLKKVKMLKRDCIFLFSWTIPTFLRIDRQNRTLLEKSESNVKVVRFCRDIWVQAYIHTYNQKVSFYNIEAL